MDLNLQDKKFQRNLYQLCDVTNLSATDSKHKNVVL